MDLSDTHKPERLFTTKVMKTAKKSTLRNLSQGANEGTEFKG